MAQRFIWNGICGHFCSSRITRIKFPSGGSGESISNGNWYLCQYQLPTVPVSMFIVQYDVEERKVF